LECLDQQLTAGTNFEFCQALLQLVLQVRGAVRVVVIVWMEAVFYVWVVLQAGRG